MAIGKFLFFKREICQPSANLLPSRLTAAHTGTAPLKKATYREYVKKNRRAQAQKRLAGTCKEKPPRAPAARQDTSFYTPAFTLH